MRRNLKNNHIELWNPIKGEAYFYGREEVKENFMCFSISKGYKLDKRINDVICQLKSIGSVIGSDNIWANVQPYDDPSLLDFNLDSTSCWKPFFNKGNLKKYFPNEKIISE